MGRTNLDWEDTKKSVGFLVIVALVGNAFVHGIGNGISVALQHANLDADVSDYLDFGKLYLSTILLSATITLAIAVYFIPQLYGNRVSWLLPAFVVVIGAPLTGVSVPATNSTPVGSFLAALYDFAIYYGIAFWGGLIVGLTGGAITYVVWQNYLRG